MRQPTVLHEMADGTIQDSLLGYLEGHTLPEPAIQVLRRLLLDREETDALLKLQNEEKSTNNAE